MPGKHLATVLLTHSPLPFILPVCSHLYTEHCASIRDLTVLCAVTWLLHQSNPALYSKFFLKQKNKTTHFPNKAQFVCRLVLVAYTDKKRTLFEISNNTNVFLSCALHHVDISYCIDTEPFTWHIKHLNPERNWWTEKSRCLFFCDHQNIYEKNTSCMVSVAADSNCLFCGL